MTYTGTILRQLCACAALLIAATIATASHAQTSLQVAFGAKGVQTIAYNGAVLEDQNSYPADSFHIWHMKSTDLNGNVLSQGQYGWGETNSGESWNAATATETYTFSWGSVSTQFVQNGNNLDMIVTEVNNPNSGIVFDGAEIYPFALHFPIDPFGGYNQYAITTTGPAVSPADFGSGVVTSVLPNESLALYGGWKNEGAATYTPIMTGTAPDGLATFLPRNDQPVQPGASLTYTVSLRFTPEGTAANAADAYASFAATYPSQLSWTDRRIIGTAFLASSPSGSDIDQPGGYPTNPRRYFNDSSVDITTPAGLQSFQNRILTQAASNVTNARNMNAQGVVTWDIEGEQYPQNTSYVCSPDQIAAVAPEMESIVTDASSPYAGQKLDDAYFNIMVSAGLRAGLCLRPQVFTFGANGTASQVFLSGNAAIVANLENKARYANSRWGVTLFYVDSTVNSLGGTLDPAIFQQLNTDLPTVLFIPEESTPRYYAYSAPFYSFIDLTSLGTPASTYLFYPHAFGANLVNDVNASTLAQYTPQLTQSVLGGDILMGHADYWQANDPTLVAIYTAAGNASPNPTSPTQSTPTLNWSAPSSIAFGTALSAAQLNAAASVPGTFIYSPAAGAVLTAGTTTLQVIFTPTDAKDYTSATASVPLVVTQSTPTFNWPAPASITVGTALSDTQLNATASIPGSFSYNPGAGTVLSTGTTTLQVTFTPTDAQDYTTATATVPLLVTAVAQSTPQIDWPTPAPIVYGTALTRAQLDPTASVPGHFTFTPSLGAILSAGNQLLQATFTPADTTHYTSATAITTLTVQQANPTLSWPISAPITAGTALSGAQLDAAASVPGSFSYNPGPGAVLNAGTTLLEVTFTPADTQDYTTQYASVPLTVNAATAPATNIAILAPLPGATVSGVIDVSGYVNLFLDSAGTFLMVDGQEVGTHRYMSAPFLYPLDTITLSNGPHTLQLWGHDIGNNTWLSAPVVVTVQN